MASVETLLKQFADVANAPKEQMNKYLGQGKKVVVCAPVYTPDELIHSMGLIPIGAWGADMEITEAKSYFPAFICSILQSILELGMKGEYDEASAIVIPSLCDSLKCLGENWKYAVPNVPFIPMTYPQNRKPEYGITYTKDGYERVIKDLEKATGATYSEESLKASIEIYNAHNEAMRSFSALLVDYPTITAKNRNDVFKSAFYMEKSEHTELVNELIEAVKAMPKEANNKIKVITSGIIADNKDLLKIFDDNNMQIVADDIAHESRQYRIDTPVHADPLQALAMKFGEMDNCSVLYDVEKKRADYIVSLAKQYDAKGVIVALTKFCDPEEFDYPILKAAFDGSSIPSTLIEIDRQMVNYEQARTNIETFKDIIQM